MYTSLSLCMPSSYKHAGTDVRALRWKDMHLLFLRWVVRVHRYAPLGSLDDRTRHHRVRCNATDAVRPFC